MGLRDRQDGIVNKNLQVKDKEIYFFKWKMYPSYLFIIYRRLYWPVFHYLIFLFIFIYL